MTTKATRGPWTWETKGEGPAIITGDGNQMVALIYGKTTDERDANADLIIDLCSGVAGAIAVTVLSGLRVAIFDRDNKMIGEVEIPQAVWDAQCLLHGWMERNAVTQMGGIKLASAMVRDAIDA